MWSWLKQSSIQTLIVLGLYLLFADHCPDVLARFFYTVAVLIKDVLMWLMPITICFFLAYTVFSFKKSAPLFLLVLIVFEACSNFLSVWYAYSFGHIAAYSIPTFDAVTASTDFQPLWKLTVVKPGFWSADKGCLAGIILGAIGAMRPNEFFTKLITRGKMAAETVMAKIFARLIPLFVLGFATHMYQTKLLHQILSQHSVLSAWLVAILALYILFLFVLGCFPKMHRLIPSIRNLIPAGLTALTSASSLSTMPWTIQGCAKNLDDPELAKAVIPATTNIQQIGDCITNAFICFMTYFHFYGTTPDFTTWLSFSIVFTLARFSTAAVIGGAIFVMLPIYEAYLQFTPEMIAIILALNVILDPLVTASNVLANGALARVFERVWRFFQPSTAVKVTPNR